MGNVFEIFKPANSVIQRITMAVLYFSCMVDNPECSCVTSCEDICSCAHQSINSFAIVKNNLWITGLPMVFHKWQEHHIFSPGFFSIHSDSEESNVDSLSLTCLQEQLCLNILYSQQQTFHYFSWYRCQNWKQDPSLWNGTGERSLHRATDWMFPWICLLQ